MDTNALAIRIAAILPKTEGDTDSATADDLQEAYQGVTTLMIYVYGQDSHQVNDLRNALKGRPPHTGVPILNGALTALQADIDSGLVGGLTKQITGDVLSDFIQLSREALASKKEGAKNVAAVLTAAAYEDTIRRIAAEFAGVVDRVNLSDVLTELKKKSILQGSQFGIAQSYLQFRNDALHADWDKIEKSGIESVLGFVQELLLKHLS